MAKCVITIEDDGDSVTVNAKFDPTLPKDGRTQAQQTAAEMLEMLMDESDVESATMDGKNINTQQGGGPQR